MTLQSVLNWNQIGVKALLENDRKKARNGFLNALHVLRYLAKNTPKRGSCCSSSSYPLLLRWTADLGNSASEEAMLKSSSFVFQRAANMYLRAGNQDENDDDVDHGSSVHRGGRQVIDGATIVVLYNLAVTFHLGSILVQDNDTTAPSQEQELCFQRAIAMYSIVWDMRTAASFSKSSERSVAKMTNKTVRLNHRQHQHQHQQQQQQQHFARFDEMLWLLDMATANNLGNLHQRCFDHARAQRFFRHAGRLLTGLRRTTTTSSLRLLSQEEQNGVFCNSLLTVSQSSPAA